MKRSRARQAIPAPVSRILRKLGVDLSAARRRRRLTMALVCERAFLSRGTLMRIERGDPGVSLGAYATTLFVLGLSDRIADLADARSDDLGLALEDEKLPKRVRLPTRAPS
jgi:transcriptional regulator with XRE-family HTH domain